MINRYQTLWLGGGPKVSIPVSQYDSMWRFRFSLIENSTPWTIPADAIAGMNGRKPDGNTFSFPADIENNTIVVDSDTQMTAVAGVTMCEVYVISGGKKVATVNFDLVVEEAPKAQGDISSDTTLPAYSEILDRIAEMEVEGVPAGGRAGEVLGKASDDDYDVEWITVEGGGGGGSSGVAFVTYNTATSADIEAAYQDGLAVFCVSGNYIYPMTERTSATNHTFSGYSGEGFITISCVANSWTKLDSTATYTPPLAAIRAPLPLGATAQVGSHNLYAREDHVHPLPSKSDLGLSNVDNTSDLAKPVSNATQTALDGKITAPSSPTAGQFLVYNGSAWVAQTVPSANGVSF